MGSCSLHNYSDIIRVEFIPDEGIEYMIPFTVYSPTITYSPITSDANVGCVLKRDTPVNPLYIAHIKDMSGELSVKESISVSGRKFVCALTYNMKQDNPDLIEQQLKYLRENYCHLLITYWGGTQHLIRSTPDSWIVEQKESDGDVQVTITVENISGAQQVI